MPINLAGGGRAGGVGDALLEIVKQRLLEQELNQRQQDQELSRRRQDRLDARQADETTYQRGRDAAADAVAKEGRDRQAKIDAVNIGKAQLAELNDRPFSELVDPETQGFGPKATPAVGLPPMPGTNVGGVSPPEVRQGQVRTVDIGGMAVKPRTMEQRDSAAAVDEQRKLENDIARAKATQKPREIAGGSLEDFVLKKYGTNPTPEQIVEARKVYNQSDDRPLMPQITLLQTNDENGMPVNKFVQKKVGDSYARPQSAVTQNRLDSAKAVAQTGQDIIAQLSDPSFKAVVGPVLGRYGTLRDFIGNPPPEFAELAGQIESYALANMGVHGMRSAQGAEQIKGLLDKRHTPESLAATITGLNNFSEHFLQNAGRDPVGPPSRVPTPVGGGFPAAGTERTVGGKTYVSDGAKFVPKGGG